jgi:hypothetical protein
MRKGAYGNSAGAWESGARLTKGDLDGKLSEYDWKAWKAGQNDI